MSRTCSRSVVLSLLTSLVLQIPAHASSLAGDEQASLWLHRNLGVAYFANEEFAEASRELTEAFQPLSEFTPQSAAIGYWLWKEVEPPRHVEWEATPRQAFPRKRTL